MYLPTNVYKIIKSTELFCLFLLHIHFQQKEFQLAQSAVLIDGLENKSLNNKIRQIINIISLII